MKKAQTSNVAILILFLIIIIILVPAFKIIYEKIFYSSQDEMCKISVLKHTGINQGTASLKSSSIDCPRNDLTFYDNKVKRNKQTLFVYEDKNANTKSRSYDKLNDHVVNQVLADELYKCWNKMGAGEYKVFEQDLVIGSDHVCLICTQFNFDVSINSNNFIGLDDYLKQYYIPNNLENITYIQYFNKHLQPLYLSLLGQRLPWGQHALNDDESPFIPGETEFNTNSNYVVYFYSFKPNKANEILKVEENSYYLVIENVKDGMKKCDYIYN